MFLKKSFFLPLLALIFLFSIEAHSVAGWSLIAPDENVVKIGNGCSGTRISNEGHILTARHCFNGCLISGGFVEETRILPEYGWRSPKLYKLNQEAQCSTTVDARDVNLKILAVGPGFMTPMEQGSLNFLDRELYKEFLENSFFHNGDFAIVKEEVNQHVSCRKVNWGEVDFNDAVTSRGYPMRSTGRPEGRNSDGESLSEASGVVIESILENSCIGEEPTNLESLILRYDREDLILSTVDNLPGGSGSALLNEKNEIIGLINSQFRQGVDVQSTYCSGSTVAIPMHHIRRLLIEGGFSEHLQSFFNCR